MLNLRLNAAERDTESQGRETIVVFQVTQFFFRNWGKATLTTVLTFKSSWLMKQIYVIFMLNLSPKLQQAKQEKVC